VPIAAYARIEDGTLAMDSLVGSVLGDRIIRSIEGVLKMLGWDRISWSIAGKGAATILAEVYGQC
jgi:hypothetical protein